MKTIEPPKPRRADLRVVVDQQHQKEQALVAVHEDQRQQAIEALQRAKERIDNDAAVIAHHEAAVVRMTRLFIAAAVVALAEAVALVVAVVT